MRTRALSLTAGVAALTLGGLLVASPASAQTLPEGAHLTIAAQYLVEQGSEGPEASQLFDTNPADGVSTPIGPVQAPIRVEAMDVLDNGLGWASVTVLGETEADARPWLIAADANTGTLTGPGVEIISDDDSVTLTDCNGLDLLPSGEILVACVDNTDGILGSYIGSVTTAGVFTAFVTREGGDSGAEILFDALAVNPVTGEMWVFGRDPAGNAYDPYVWSVNRDAGTLGDPTLMEEGVIGADFDRNGQLFVTISGSEDGNKLGTTVPTSSAPIPVTLVPTDGSMTNDGNNLRTVHALTVWGLPALPATGPMDLLPIGLGTALLFLAGAAFVATNRIQRRAE